MDARTHILPRVVRRMSFNGYLTADDHRSSDHAYAMQQMQGGKAYRLRMHWSTSSLFLKFRVLKKKVLALISNVLQLGVLQCSMILGQIDPSYINEYYMHGQMANVQTILLALRLTN